VPLPGVKPDSDEVEISIDGSILTIRARLPDAEPETAQAAPGDSPSAPSEGRPSSPPAPTRVRWIAREVPRGEVARTIELPVAVDADRATAHFSGGLLILTLPKAQAARPRRINVTPGA